MLFLLILLLVSRQIEYEAKYYHRRALDHHTKGVGQLAEAHAEGLPRLPRGHPQRGEAARPRVQKRLPRPYEPQGCEGAVRREDAWPCTLVQGLVRRQGIIITMITSCFIFDIIINMIRVALLMLLTIFLFVTVSSFRLLGGVRREWDADLGSG